MTGWLSDH